MASKTISRRGFLKAGLVAAAAVATTSIPREAEAQSEEPLVTLFDLTKCVGCESCVEACRESNTAKFPNPKKPFPKMYPDRVKVEDWSEKQDVTDRLTPYNWLFVQHVEVEINEEPTELFIPRRCMHCVNPPCVKLCPWGAARQYQNGISRIDTDLCMGGAKCRNVCPWHIPQRQTGDGLYLKLLPSLAGNGIMNKCDRCYQRVARGQNPACIDACPENVQSIGPRSQMVAKAHDLAKEIGGYIYGEKENGGTNTIYVSPIPFEIINKAIEKGPGKPHMKPVADTMADANNLALAMAVAPVAGVFAALGTFRKAKSEMKKGGDQS